MMGMMNHKREPYCVELLCIRVFLFLFSAELLTQGCIVASSGGQCHGVKIIEGFNLISCIYNHPLQTSTVKFCSIPFHVCSYVE